MLVGLDSLDLSYSTVGIDPSHVHDTVMASFELCVLTVPSENWPGSPMRIHVVVCVRNRYILFHTIADIMDKVGTICMTGHANPCDRMHSFSECILSQKTALLQLRLDANTCFYPATDTRMEICYFLRITAFDYTD